MATITGTSDNDTLTGTSSDDTLVGSAGDDFYDGNAGFDTLDFRATATALMVDFTAGTVDGGFTGTFVDMERVLAGNGDDTLIGAAGGQNLSGRAGNDTLEGRAGNDWLWGGGGDDWLVFRETGSANADDIGDFSSGSDKIVLDATVMTALGATGAFTTGDARFWSSTSGTAHDADDRVIYETDTRQIWYDPDGSGAAARQLIATLQSGATLVATDIVVEGEHTPPPGGATEGDDVLIGTAGDDTIDGLGGNDVISGLEGDDHLSGGPGNDNLAPGAGNDTVLAGGGDDVIGLSSGDPDDPLADPGNDAIDGGAGVDFVAFSIEGVASVPVAVTVDLAAGIYSGGSPGGGGTIVNVEDVQGSWHDDHITGSAADNVLAGDSGNDTIEGLGGLDTLEGGGGDDSIAGGAGWDSLTGGPGQDVFAFAEFGSGMNDVITDFASGTDAIELDPAAFTAIGASGAFTADDVRFWAGPGQTAAHDADDRLIYDTTSGILYYDADGDGPGGQGRIAILQGAPTLAATDIVVKGDDTPSGGATEGDDTLVGTEGPDTIDGLGGNDSISGLGGDDHLIGGAGQDTLEGGAGDDTYIIDSEDVYSDTGGLDTVFSTTSHTLLDGSGVENLVINSTSTFLIGEGNELDNVITNASDFHGEGYLNGGGGNDTLVGGRHFVFYGQSFSGDYGHDFVDGAGDDGTLYFEDFSAVVVDFRTGSVIGGGTGRVDFVDIRRVVSGDFDDEFFASDAGSIAYGGGGNDTFDGGAGDDVFSDDGILVYDGASIESIAEGSDELSGGAGNDLLIINRGDDAVDAGDGDDTINIDIGFYAAGSGYTYGNDTIDGGAGIDTLSVGMVSPVVVDLGAGTMTGGGVDGSGTAVLISVENFDTSRSFGGDHHLVGSAVGNVLTTRSGDDTLNGAGGSDTLTGGSGADVYDFDQAPGEANADLITDMSFGGVDLLRLHKSAMPALGAEGRMADGDPRFRVGSSAADADDRLIYDGNSLYYDPDGSGPVAQLRIVTVGSGGPGLQPIDIEIVGDGSAGGELIVGTAGSDTLQGGAGDDTLSGLGGSDVLVGSGGSDFYDGGAGSDTLDFRATGTALAVDFGAGTVSGGFDGTFAGIERVLAGNGNDVLTGAAGAQNLSGRAGSDTLEGGSGNDWLWGGGDDDVFIFRETGAANEDDIGDFSAGADTIALDNAVMAALGAEGAFAAGDDRFFFGAGASGGADAEDRVVYDTTSGALYYDADGSGAGGAELIATLQGSPGLAATDITVI